MRSMNVFVKFLAAMVLLMCLSVQADTGAIGVVVMHGKGGSPSRFVSDLAYSLQRRGFQVENIEMPWSGRREYDVNVAGAEAEVESAISRLRTKGVNKVFVTGHSQGGIFALYFGSKYKVDGVVAIAPGGNVGNTVFREKLAEALSLARKNLDEGKGAEKVQLSDYEGGKGVYPVSTTSASYLTWFEPDGAMNQANAMKAFKAEVPVLYIAPVNDYPALARANGQLYELLPKHPLTQLYQPASSHLNAPASSAQAIGDWMSMVSGGK
jgi:pimeloyl-ACP methyl ester carboxylesterase